MPAKREAKGVAGHRTLGTNVIPRRYALHFRPNLKTFRYSGTAAIDVEIGKPVKEISLNSAELGISRASVESGPKIQDAKVRTAKADQTITLAFKKAVKGTATIRISFTGVHNDGMYGFYRSRYSKGGKAGYILTSQFEAANARNAFPCFDEPEYKAKFSVSFTVGRGLECISNMPVARTSMSGRSEKTVTFMETPVMSAYLLYLGVGKYERVSGKAGRTTVSVITTPGNKALARLPFEYAKRFISFYEEYFGIKYPLPKVDLISVPDFAVGGMENWGALTFRETALLADRKTSVAGKQRVAEVIAHELAHQWFGDLVTMKWWNDLWLNESFATFMSYKAMDAVFPEWDIMVEYLKDVIATAFGADQLRSTHPISVQVRSPEEIDQLFDEISYEKGGTILNMLEKYAGAGIFRSGLHRYLKEHSYSNAIEADLWRAIDKEARARHARVQASRVASYWINKPGYPIIEARRERGFMKLSQKRYFLLSGMSDTTLWPIPVNYMVGGRKGTILFDGSSATIKAPDDAWVKLNAGQSGLYRVSYGGADVARLGRLIRSKEMDWIDAWGVEHDIFARSRSGRMNAESYLDFVKEYCMEAEHPLNSNVLGHLNWVSDRLGPERNARAKELLVLYSNHILGDLGWERRESESTSDTLMRSYAIIQSGIAGYEPTLATACGMFDDFIGKGKEIDPNLRGAVYSLAAWARGERVFGVLKERFSKEKVPDEKIRFLRAMSMFNDSGLVLKALDFSMSDAVRTQDKFIVPAIASSNPAARYILLDWTKRNWKTLMKTYSSGTHMLLRFVSNLAILDTEQERAEVQRFFSAKGNSRDDIKQALDKTLEQIEANIRFAEANA